MQIERTDFPGLLVITPKIFGDQRGYFYESFNARVFEAETGIRTDFVQDNQSLSTYGVLRGLHYQRLPFTQTKLVRVISGSVLDVVVDLRRGSPTFGRSFSIELSGENHRQLYIPKGFAHGFVTLSQTAIFVYKCEGYYHSASDAGVLYSDPELAIDWQLPASDLIISSKDAIHPPFHLASYDFEYRP